MYYQFHISIVAVIQLLIIVGKLSTTTAVTTPTNDHIWTYNCINNKCKKRSVQQTHDPKPKDKNITSLNVCRLFCEDYGSLWPLPTGIFRIGGHNLVSINTNDIVVRIEMDQKLNDSSNSQNKKFYKKVSKNFKQKILKKNKSKNIHLETDKQKKLEVTANIKNPIITMELNTDESYTIEIVSDIKVNIGAETVFGVIRALETTSQLIVYDEISSAIVMPSSVLISDKPEYKYRGLTLDTSRNYITLKTLKRTIDGMSLNKLNILHWHITDSDSFPFVSSTYPQFSKYGAYSPDKVYKPDDIKQLIEYAKVRGVRLIPEFDAPAHVGEGWQWTENNTVVCLNAQPWTAYCVEAPCGQMNPTSENLYKILEGLYNDIISVFQLNEIFHMGGDEVKFSCWRSSKEITSWMRNKGWKRNNEGFLKLWNYFQEKALDIVKKVSNNKIKDIILWTSHFTTGQSLDKYVDKNQYIIQIWTKAEDEAVAELISKGYRVIFSNYDALYLDCGFGSWVSTDGLNWCAPYIPWNQLYENKPLENVKQLLGDKYNETMDKLILGQSAALWTEQADNNNIDNRLWPRLCGLAERTWSDPSINWVDAQNRLFHQRERLTELGIVPDALQPQWCDQNQGDCEA